MTSRVYVLIAHDILASVVTGQLQVMSLEWRFMLPVASTHKNNDYRE